MSAKPGGERWAIGVDLGGTKVAAGLFDGLGRLHGRLFVLPTEADGPRERTVANVLGAVESALEMARLRRVRPAGIGVGSTGPLDPSTGLLLEAASLPRLFHFPLAGTIERRFSLRVRMTNDGNAFALAESAFGAGKGRGIVLGVTLGTGCGCGIVIHGRILEGATANTGELYRTPLLGRDFDAVLSGRGLERAFRERAGRSVPGDDIARLAAAGHRVAREAFAAFGRNVAVGLGILAAVIDPHVIVLGGSVSKAFRHFAPALRELLPRYLAPEAARRIEVRRSLLGARAGAVGGAALIFSDETIR